MLGFTASTAASFLYLVPVLAFLIAIMWPGEAPTAFFLVGGLLVISGVMVVNRWGRAKL
jgi:drug/metabolite transporter (DMT)-like permease